MATTKCKVLKDFPYAHDGIKAENLVAGDVRDIQSDCVPGLKAEGYVEVAASAPTPAEGEGDGAEDAAHSVEADAEVSDEGRAAAGSHKAPKKSKR